MTAEHEPTPTFKRTHGIVTSSAAKQALDPNMIGFSIYNLGFCQESQMTVTLDGVKEMRFGTVRVCRLSCRCYKTDMSHICSVTENREGRQTLPQPVLSGVDWHSPRFQGIYAIQS